MRAALLRTVKFTACVLTVFASCLVLSMQINSIQLHLKLRGGTLVTVYAVYCMAQNNNVHWRKTNLRKKIARHVNS